MRYVICLVLVLLNMTVPAGAAEISAPIVPDSGAEFMPEETESFGDGLLSLLQKGIDLLQPELRSAVGICVKIVSIALLFSLWPAVCRHTERTFSAAFAAVIFILMFQYTDSLIRLASVTVEEICAYGKLLCPVMTTALAAQGAVTSSSALYMGTTVFTAVLGSVIAKGFVPLVYGFLAISAANSALGEEYLRKIGDNVKSLLGWALKTMLILFTSYMSITGVVSGTTDAAALKAAKVTITTVVPVVGGILSDASEAVLVSAGLIRNAAGVYGILAVLAILLEPFLKIGVQYLALKFTSALCSVFAAKNISALVNDLSAAMGLLLAMLAAAGTMVLISTVCFLRGIG